jgi:hypothetical protein
MNQELSEVAINGVTYVKKDSVTKNVESIDGLRLVIVRTEKAGVHYGYLKRRTGNEVQLVRTRRIWYWKGASELSQLAAEGVKKPAECKFSVYLDEAIILGVIEILPVSSVAQLSIDSVVPWRQ